MTTRSCLRGAVRTCASCLAWGRTMAHELCWAYYLFGRKHAVGQCVGCARREPLRNQYCRLCWCQARLLARESGEPVGLAKPSCHLQRVQHHQLFFANMLSTRGASTTPPRTRGRRGRRGRPRKQPPRSAARPAAGWVQPFRFDNLRRDYTRFNERTDVNLNNPWLAWGLHLAHQFGENRGWGATVRSDADRVLTILLSGHLDGDVVRYSDMVAAMRALKLTTERAGEVLAEMGVLVDDRRSSFEDWLQGKLDGLAPGIAREVESWLRTLHKGGPRSRAFRASTRAVRSPVLGAQLECSAGKPAPLFWPGHP